MAAQAEEGLISAALGSRRLLRSARSMQVCKSLVVMKAHAHFLCNAHAESGSPWTVGWIDCPGGSDLFRSRTHRN